MKVKNFINSNVFLGKVNISGKLGSNLRHYDEQIDGNLEYISGGYCYVKGEDGKDYTTLVASHKDEIILNKNETIESLKRKFTNYDEFRQVFNNKNEILCINDSGINKKIIFSKEISMNSFIYFNKHNIYTVLIELSNIIDKDIELTIM